MDRKAQPAWIHSTSGDQTCSFLYNSAKHKATRVCLGKEPLEQSPFRNPVIRNKLFQFKVYTQPHFHTSTILDILNVCNKDGNKHPASTEIPMLSSKRNGRANSIRSSLAAPKPSLEMQVSYAMATDRMTFADVRKHSSSGDWTATASTL